MEYLNRTKYCLILSFCFLNACGNPSETETLPDFFDGYSDVKIISEPSNPLLDISFSKEMYFGDSDNLLMDYALDVEVDHSGNVFLKNEHSIHVFDQNGNYKESIGREGRGPGEFLVIHNLKIKNGRLYVYDANLSRVSIFDTDTFELKNEISIPSINGLVGLGEFDILNDEFLIVGMPESKQSSDRAVLQRYMHYFLVDHNGQAIDPAIKTTKIINYYEVNNSRGTSIPPIPFGRTTLFTLSPSGNMYFAWTDQIAIKVFDSAGSFMRGIFYPYQNVAIEDDSDFMGLYKVLNIIPDTKRILGDELPESFPAISNLIVDEKERIWLSAVIDDDNLDEWWVLEKSGELIAKFTWPKDEPIEMVRDDKIYTRKTNEESGTQQIVRYGLEMRRL